MDGAIPLLNCRQELIRGAGFRWRSVVEYQGSTRRELVQRRGAFDFSAVQSFGCFETVSLHTHGAGEESAAFVDVLAMKVFDRRRSGHRDVVGVALGGKLYPVFGEPHEGYKLHTRRPIDRTGLAWGRRAHALRALVEIATWDTSEDIDAHHGHPWPSLLRANARTRLGCTVSSDGLTPDLRRSGPPAAPSV